VNGSPGAIGAAFASGDRGGLSIILANAPITTTADGKGTHWWWKGPRVGDR
jgi:hypothetical protein